MSLLSKLERRFGRFAIPNVTLVLIAGQVGMYLLSLVRPGVLELAVLAPRPVMAGEFWRLVTTLFVPPLCHPVWAFFFWTFFWFIGTAMESFWGTFRYNVYLLICYVATSAVAFVTPDQPVWFQTAILKTTVFLAFAFLNPEFEIYVMFILPVKCRWLALLTWLGYSYAVVVGPWPARLIVLASVCNFLLFFGRDLMEKVKTGRRRMAWQAKVFAASRAPGDPFHRCVVCGITDKTHPKMDFRYCTECHGTCGYCTEHIFRHIHVTEFSASANK